MFGMPSGNWQVPRVEINMAEAAQSTQQEFWRPPTPVMGQEGVQAESIPAMAEVCPRCNTEFLLGAQFCHICGVRRSIVVIAEKNPKETAVEKM